MRKTLIVRDLLPKPRVELRLFRRIVQSLLDDLLHERSGDLAFYLVDDTEMTRLNETFLRHQGSTDVITFDYAQAGETAALCGEIFLCLPEARKQSRRFRVTWQSELVRYAVHGVLHLCGYEDHRAVERTRMKGVENRLLRELGRRFDFRELALAGRRKRAGSDR